jgi:aminoglycoside phosphotransferase (APT) family kinase protein
MNPQDAWSRVPHAAGLKVHTAEVLQKKKRKAEVWRLKLGDGASNSVIAKRCSPEEARHETYVYQVVLPEADVPTLHCFGAVPDTDLGLEWLIVEEACGDPFSSEDPAHRLLAARWLANLHACCSHRSSQDTLPDVGARHYEAMLGPLLRTLAAVRSNPALGADEEREVAALEDRILRLQAGWTAVARLSDHYPSTLVHGSFGQRNMRVRRSGDRPELCVFDWGAAGWGPPARDVAKLVGRGVLADIADYRAALGDRYPIRAGGSVEDLVTLGRCFRAIEHLVWIAPRLAYEWVEGPLETMRRHHRELEETEPRLLEFADV